MCQNMFSLENKPVRALTRWFELLNARGGRGSGGTASRASVLLSSDNKRNDSKLSLMCVLSKIQLADIEGVRRV